MNRINNELSLLLKNFSPEWTVFVTQDLAPYVAKNELLEECSDGEKNLAVLNSIFVSTGEVSAEILPQLLQTESNLSEFDAVLLASEIVQQIVIATALFNDKGVKIKLNQTDDSVPIPRPPKYVSPKVAAEATSRIEKIRPKPSQGAGDPYREPIG